jgi:hypothetical protein
MWRRGVELIVIALLACSPGAQAQKLSDIECFRSPECRAASEARPAEKQLQREAEQKAQNEAYDKAEAAQELRQVANRKACGKDYMAPRIGMPIKRALQCLGEFRMTGQVNRKDGILTTYTNDDAMLQAIDGKLVSWVEY